MIRKFFAVAALFALVTCAPPIAYARLPSGMLVYTFNNYTHLAANATTVIKAQPGLLSTICVNTKGATANTMTVYDNASAASGTVIAAIDTTSLGCYRYDVSALNGITVIIATGTAADVTVVWR